MCQNYSTKGVPWSKGDCKVCDAAAGAWWMLGGSDRVVHVVPHLAVRRRAMAPGLVDYANDPSRDRFDIKPNELIDRSNGIHVAF